MKNFINVTIDGKSVRLLELTTLEQATPTGRSLAGIAQEEACKLTVVKMSRAHPYLFSWGHEESDSRTWLHGVAENGNYRSV